MERYDNVLNELCLPHWRDIYFDFCCDRTFKQPEKVFDFACLNTNQKHESLDKMRKISNKPYPNTVQENKIVFDRYLKLCERHNIKVMVLIPPFSKFFREHFPLEYVKEMRNIVYEYCEKYDFEILDLYESSDFVDDGYYEDEDHLNIYGASMLTQMVDEYLLSKVYEW